MFSFDEYFAVLSKLVSFDTQSSDIASFDKSNKNLIDFAADWLRQLKFEVTVIKLVNGKYNLLASFNGRKGGLLLSGHTDTVPCDADLWSSDPFVLTKKDNCLYGLGSCDMKGFVALALCFAKNAVKSGYAYPLQIVLTADEETSMLGAQSFIKAPGVKPELIIIGEPSSLKCISAHKGYMARKVVFKGKSCHSSDPEQGINAIKIAGAFINELNLLEQELKQYKDGRFLVPYPTLNPGAIKGGDSVNRVCPEVVLLFDLRPTPKFDAFEADQRIKDISRKLNEVFNGAITIEVPYPDIDVFDNDNRKVADLFNEVLGEKSIGVNYCTEASLMKKVAPTVVFGPGDIANAHQVDEHIDIEQIHRSYEVLEKIYAKLAAMA